MQLKTAGLSGKHPVIVLHDVRFSELKAILEFVYSGEVSIAESELPRLLSIGDNLQIRGLMERDERLEPGHHPQTSSASSNHLRERRPTPITESPCGTMTSGANNEHRSVADDGEDQPVALVNNKRSSDSLSSRLVVDEQSTPEDLASKRSKPSSPVEEEEGDGEAVWFARSRSVEDSAADLINESDELSSDESDVLRGASPPRNFGPGKT